MYIRAGSIVPIGPEMQHTREKDMRHLDIRIYRGRDCDFTLYQDDGESLQYLEGNVFGIVPFKNETCRC